MMYARILTSLLPSILTSMMVLVRHLQRVTRCSWNPLPEVEVT